MKAKVIREPYRLANLKIGEVVEIIPGMETDAEGVWNVPAGKLVLCKKGDGTFCYSSLLDMEIVDETPSVDWQSFRREAAKDILAGMLSNPEHIHIDNQRLKTIEGFVNGAVMIADELIKATPREMIMTTEICGHCAAMRPDNGYCTKKGRYVNFFDRAICFISDEEKPAESPKKPAESPKKRRNRPITTANRTEKVCSCCGRLLPLSEFVVSRRSADGHDCYCRACKAMKRKQWKDAKKESAAND